MTVRYLRTILLVPGLLLGMAATGPALAQSAGQQSIGGFLGVTDRTSADFTIGAEYEYHLDSTWSVGGLLEYTPDAFGSSDATVVMGTANYRFADLPRLKLTGGVGMEFRPVDDDFRFRIGAGYDVITEPVTVTPRIALDFGGGANNVILGGTFSRRF